MTGFIKYDAAGIEGAQAGLVQSMQRVSDGASQSQAGYARVETTSEGASTQAAMAFNQESQRLVAEYNDLVNSLNQAISRSHEEAAANDAAAASRMG